MREPMRFLRRPRRARWRRWVDGIDPWMPRPLDYVAAAALFLGLALLYVGQRSYAVQLDRRIFRLEERRVALRDRNDVLAARATSLADRDRIVSIAQRDLGMVVPAADAFAYVYYVPPAGRAPRARPAAPSAAGMLPPGRGAYRR
jgi:hypothetical protein